MVLSKTTKTLHKNQLGFQEGKYTEHRILDLYTSVTQSVEKLKKPSHIFLDFANIFDLVHHKTLINKLEYYGVGVTEMHWLKSYLSNKRQAVNVSLNQSSFQTVVSGVPQGSLL